MYEIKLTYFKRSGKYYTEDTYITDKQRMWEISDEVKEMRNKGELPGVCGNEWIVHIDTQNHPSGYPSLIL